MELCTDWSLWVLEHGLPLLPDQVAERSSVPVTWWRGTNSAAVLHLRRWPDDGEDASYTEVDIQVFASVDGRWQLTASGGAGGWPEALVRPVEVRPEHADLGGVVQGTSGGVEVVALWGEAGRFAASLEVEQEGVVTTRPVEGELGWVVVSAVVQGPVIARVRDGDGRVLTEAAVGPMDEQMDGPWLRP